MIITRYDGLCITCDQHLTAADQLPFTLTKTKWRAQWNIWWPCRSEATNAAPVWQKDKRRATVAQGGKRAFYVSRLRSCETGHEYETCVRNQLHDKFFFMSLLLDQLDNETWHVFLINRSPFTWVSYDWNVLSCLEVGNTIKWPFISTQL